MRTVVRSAFRVLVVGLVLAPTVALAGTIRTGDAAHDGGLQWGFDRIRAAEAWSVSRGEGATIAVIDSGVAAGHEDLRANLDPGIACNDTGGDPDRCSGPATDEDGHGTHVAGIAAAVAGNATGVAGVAPDARILPVKVLHEPCDGCPVTGNAPDVAAAIRWAAARGADVINLSLGSTTSSVFGPGFVEAVADAWEQGAIPVVAAGNELVQTADFGDAPAVVVSAVDRDDGAPSYSSGVGTARWSLAAPGGESDDTASTCSPSGEPRGILSTFWAPGDDATYACLSGTSMAAPHVSGGLALLLSAGLDPTQAIEALRTTAVDIGAAGDDPLFGSGRIDLAAAAAAIPAVAAATATTTTLPASAEEGGSAPPAPPGETSSPQVFVTDDDGSVSPPLPLVAVAVLGILGCAVALFELDRRRLV